MILLNRLLNIHQPKLSTMASRDRDEALTPAGRLFVQPIMSQIINCVIGVENQMDPNTVKAQVNNSLIPKHPRFCSLMVRDSSGREYWRRTEVDLDRQIIVFNEPLSDDPSISDEDAVNDYLADLSVSSPLSTDKPLWEIHLMMAHNCAVVRFHHALGDGISLMALLLSCCRKADDPTELPTVGGGGSSVTTARRRRSLWTLMKVMWYTLVYVLEFMLRALWLKDKKTVLSGGDGVELWPRKLATARFKLDDMKMVKNAITDATINDVLFGVLSCGFSRYLDIRSPRAVQEGLQLTGAAMVNLRLLAGLQDISKLMNNESATRWGNKFGMVLLPIYYHRGDSDPLQFVKRAKSMIDKKKLSLEAHFSYKIGHFVMTFLGAKIASILNYRIVCNTTFTISNVIGPREKITFAGNPLTYIRANSTALPHAITMHMVSYGDRADMQVLVAKDLIPDPEVLVKCFEDALLEMKEAAKPRR